MSTNLWDHEDPITDLGIDVPAWISQDISPATVAAIVQGGCASGAYMPAVTYHAALATMSEHGDDVLLYIDNEYGELPPIGVDASWSSIACHFLSCAVELWASAVESELEDALAALEDSDNDA